MVHICKPKKDERTKDFLTRVAALMINMQYNKKLYDLDNLDVDKSNKEKFNVVKYDHFNDTYNFNSGFIYIISDASSSSDVSEVLRKLTDKLDVLADKEILMHTNMGTDLVTTQYTLLWTKVKGGKHGRKFKRTEDFSSYAKKRKSKYCGSVSDFKFVWHVGDMFDEKNTRLYEDYDNCRSLSTIIVDIDNVVKYNEVGLPITSPITFTYNNINISQFGDKYYDFKINISEKFGIETIFAPDYMVEKRRAPKEIPFIEYDNDKLNICAVKRVKKMNVYSALNLAAENYTKKKFATKQEMAKKISEWDKCALCANPVYGDIYLYRLNGVMSVHNFIIICKFCLHYREYFTPYNANKLYRTKIPRTLHSAIDLFTPKHIPELGLKYYRECLKLIDMYCPDKIESKSLTRLKGKYSHVGITGLFANKWKNFNIYKNYDCEILIGVTYA